MSEPLFSPELEIIATAEVVHPERELTPAERRHLGLDDDTTPEEFQL